MENYMFDFDGTLADSGETAVLATQATFKDFGLSLPSSNVYQLSGALSGAGS